MWILVAASAVSAGMACPVARSQEPVLEERFDRVPEGRVPRGWDVRDGTWEVEGGELVGRADGEGALVLPVAPEGPYELEAAVRFLRAREPTRWLAVRLGRGAEPEVLWHQVTLRRALDRDDAAEHAVRRRGGGWDVRARRRAADDAGTGAFRIRVRAGGGRIRLRVDGRPVLDAFFARDLRPGPVAFAVSGAEVAFDDVTVRALTAAERAAHRIRFGPLREVVVIAHRGASATAPENTLAALRLALDRGAAACEFDVRRARDAALVLLHDEDVLRTTDFRNVFGEEKAAAVDSLGLDELRRLDAGAWKAPRWAGEAVPTFDAALELLRGKALPVVEIKDEAIGADVARAVRAAGMEEQVFVQSFSPRAVREFREVLPSVPTGLLIGERVVDDAPARAREHVRRAREAGASAVVCDHTLAHPGYVREVHRRAMALWVYTVNDRTRWDVLVRIGVDGIITDVPGRLDAFLEAGVEE